MNILQAAVDAPWLAGFAIYVAYYALRLPFWAWNRLLRSRSIASHGWPTNPLMDADGDIVHPRNTQRREG